MRNEEKSRRALREKVGKHGCGKSLSYYNQPSLAEGSYSLYFCEHAMANIKASTSVGCSRELAGCCKLIDLYMTKLAIFTSLVGNENFPQKYS